MTISVLLGVGNVVSHQTSRAALYYQIGLARHETYWLLDPRREPSQEVTPGAIVAKTALTYTYMPAVSASQHLVKRCNQCSQRADYRTSSAS